MPGIFGKERVDAERARLKNEGQPLRQLPAGVNHSANMSDPANWVDPLNGYAYDSFNKDALLRLASTQNGKLVLSTGAQYNFLIIPGVQKMSPNKNMISNETATKIRELIKEGATLMLPAEAGLINKIISDENPRAYRLGYDSLGKGRIVYAPYFASTFDQYGFTRDVIVTDKNGKTTHGIAWNHRRGENFDIYFITVILLFSILK